MRNISISQDARRVYKFICYSAFVLHNLFHDSPCFPSNIWNHFSFFYTMWKIFEISHFICNFEFKYAILSSNMHCEFHMKPVCPEHVFVWVFECSILIGIAGINRWKHIWRTSFAFFISCIKIVRCTFAKARLWKRTNRETCLLSALHCDVEKFRSIKLFV